MKLQEYQLNAERTCPDKGILLNLAHGVMGIVSELEELEEAYNKKDIINIGEEAGDVLWYFANYLRFREIPVTEFDKILGSSVPSTVKEVGFTIRNLYTISSKLTDIVKKHIFYSREILTDKELDLLRMIVVNISILLETFNINPEEVLDKNINKLKVRFPDAFSEENANNRNLDAELTVLSNGQ